LGFTKSFVLLISQIALHNRLFHNRKSEKDKFFVLAIARSKIICRILKINFVVLFAINFFTTPTGFSSTIIQSYNPGKVDSFLSTL